MADTIRWGILGTGWIARQMAEALKLLPDAEFVAIASRTLEKAETFGHEFGVPRQFGCYEDLVSCPDVDVVYVATPHSSHARDATLALRAGKPVLCEKPLTVNAREAADLVATARSERLFLMEAMWSRLVPTVVRLREWIAAGAIGQVRLLTASIGWRRSYDPQSRLYDPNLAGGALLDIGVYPVSLASMLFGPPSEVHGVMQAAPTGVDAQCALSLGHPGGELASLVATFVADAPCDAFAIGTEGTIRVHPPIIAPQALTRRSLDGAKETVELPHLGNGYAHEAIEVMECLRAGKLESSVMPLDESLSIMRTLDRIRDAWSLRYPSDEV
ncbi:Gfo/Idh/MocA family oxidoreductase [Candidatus Bipolaricaulota bacterium]|nr:Gfo/Idh/MocA family oxidoreductase [Candidatus Bipolaricaulota bacterium]